MDDNGNGSNESRTNVTHLCWCAIWYCHGWKRFLHRPCVKGLAGAMNRNRSEGFCWGQLAKDYAGKASDVFVVPSCVCAKKAFDISHVCLKRKMWHQTIPACSSHFPCSGSSHRQDGRGRELGQQDGRGIRGAGCRGEQICFFPMVFCCVKQSFTMENIDYSQHQVFYFFLKNA